MPKENWIEHKNHLGKFKGSRLTLQTDLEHVIVSTVDLRFALGSAAEAQFETMVFAKGSKCECGCGEHVVKDYKDLDCNRYDDIESAKEGHVLMCEKWDGRKSIERMEMEEGDDHGKKD